MSVTLKEFGSILSYQDVNEILKLFASATAPASPYDGQTWLDTSTLPLQLKRYNGSGWDTIAGAATDILNQIKTVDGTGSGLDADKLDGQEGTYYRNAGNLNAGTLPRARLAIWKDSAGETQNCFIQTMLAYIPATTTQVTFPLAFTSIFAIITTAYNTGSLSPHLTSAGAMTTTGVNVRRYDYTGASQTGYVCVVAVGRLD